MNTFVRRLLGAAVLDASVYEEVEADQGATTQALAVVLLSSLAAGLGWQDVGANSPASVAVFSTIALIAWVGWAFVTYEIGVRILPEPQTQSNLGELLRTIGFATAPGLLRVFGLLPGARDLVFGVTAVWMLFAMIVAVRQALDYKHTGRAVGVCALGWALSIVFAFVLGLLFGPSVASPSLARTDEQRTGGTPSGFITPSLYGRDNFDFFCAPCHGLEGRGDGPIAAALKTPPSDSDEARDEEQRRLSTAASRGVCHQRPPGARSWHDRDAGVGPDVPVARTVGSSRQRTDRQRRAVH